MEALVSNILHTTAGDMRLDEIELSVGGRPWTILHTGAVISREEEREFLLALCLRAEQLDPQARYDLMEEVGDFYRLKLAIDDEHLSGENLVRDLTGVVFAEQVARKGPVTPAARP